MKKIAHILILLFIFTSISCGKDYDEYIDTAPQKKTTDKEETSSTGEGNGTESGNEDEDNKKGSEKDLDDQEDKERNKNGECCDNNTLVNGNNNDNGSNDETTNNDSINTDFQSDEGYDDEEDTHHDDGYSNQDERDSTKDETDNSADEESQTPACRIEKYMDLQCESGYSAQGGACYGGYSGNKIITVYNLKKKKRIGSFDTSGPYNSRIHVNTMNFGNQRSDSNDEFPILYVSSGYTINGYSRIYAYRIQKSRSESSEEFTFSLIQTITLKDFGSWTEGILDNENDCLWIKYEKNGAAGPYGYAKFDVPDINEGDVSIDFNDYSDNFLLPAEPIPSSNQGHLFIEGKIVLVSGVPSRSEKLAFISINTLTHERETIIDLAEAGLVNKHATKDNAYEPEGCIIHEGDFMICYRRFIYIFQSNE